MIFKSLGKLIFLLSLANCLTVALICGCRFYRLFISFQNYKSFNKGITFSLIFSNLSGPLSADNLVDRLTVAVQKFLCGCPRCLIVAVIIEKQAESSFLFPLASVFDHSSD